MDFLLCLLEGDVVEGLGGPEGGLEDKLWEELFWVDLYLLGHNYIL